MVSRVPAQYTSPDTRPCFRNHEILAEFRWCREGAASLVRRPGPRPAPLGRPGHISGVPSRPKHPAQPLALDVGSPRAALVAGTCINSSHVTRRHIQPAQPARTTHARPSISFGACILRGSRTAGGPSRFETQGCAADGTADSPELWRAVTSAIMCE